MAITGYEIVNNSVSIADGNSDSVQALAPEGKVVVGGGWTHDGDPALVHLTKNESGQYGDSWDVAAHNASGTTITLRVRAAFVNAS